MATAEYNIIVHWPTATATATKIPTTSSAAGASTAATPSSSSPSATTVGLRQFDGWPLQSAAGYSRWHFCCHGKILHSTVGRLLANGGNAANHHRNSGDQQPATEDQLNRIRLSPADTPNNPADNEQQQQMGFHGESSAWRRSRNWTAAADGGSSQVVGSCAGKRSIPGGRRSGWLQRISTRGGTADDHADGWTPTSTTPKGGATIATGRRLSLLSVVGLRNHIRAFVHADHRLHSRLYSGLLAARSDPIRRCLYTFVARPNERVRLEFSHFQLAGTANHCESEYVDVYSELESPTEDLLSANLGARYCGTVAPNVRISLHNVLVLVLHSRIGRHRSEPFALAGRFEYIPEAPFLPGLPLGPSRSACGFLVESDGGRRARGSILSPTYPGAYPSNFHCIYHLRGSAGERIRLYFRDFDVYFGGEHCPYDSVTIHDGGSTQDPILRKLCGLQQRLELFSFGPELLLEFNTTEPPKNDLRGFNIEYTFSNRFVDVGRLIGPQPQRHISHLRGSECDIRVRSNRESVHYIHSPNYPDMFPPNTTCTYVLDGLQSDQNLEKVLLRFETFQLAPGSELLHQQPMATGGRAPSSRPVNGTLGATAAPAATGHDECSSGAFVGIATMASSIKAAMGNSDEGLYDAMLCDRVPAGSPKLGPYVSQGPRIVLIFSSVDREQHNWPSPHGFRARVEFKTDFGIAGESIGGSNRCAFRFRDPSGSFNSPRYPANYPLDTDCTYHIVGQPGKQILLHFKQFALFEDNSKEECNDWLQIFDVFYELDGRESLRLQAKHCWHVFPGPTISSYGAHEMRVIFHSDGFGTANGFDAHYEIRDAFEEEVPTRKDHRHCGELIQASEQQTTGHFESPGYPIKYGTNKQCDWEIRVRPQHQVLLKPNAFNVEGQMTEEKIDCMSAVLRVHLSMQNRTGDLQLCGENMQMIPPIVSPSNSIRLSFLTSPDKVNGLQGFNFSWTEIRRVQSDSECSGEELYLCSYTRLCIDSRLRCNGEENCGQNDDSDEAHCSRILEATDKRTIIIAYIVSGLIFLFILSFFCFLFKSKLERKGNKKHEENRRRRKQQQWHSRHGSGRRHGSSRRRDGGGGDAGNEPRPRQPFRQPKPRPTTMNDRHRPSGAISMLGRQQPLYQQRHSEDSNFMDGGGRLSYEHSLSPPQHHQELYHPHHHHHSHPQQQPFGLLPPVHEHSPIGDGLTSTAAASLALGDIPSTLDPNDEEVADDQREDGNDVKIFYG